MATSGVTLHNDVRAKFLPPIKIIGLAALTQN